MGSAATRNVGYNAVSDQIRICAVSPRTSDLPERSPPTWKSGHHALIEVRIGVREVLHNDAPPRQVYSLIAKSLHTPVTVEPFAISTSACRSLFTISSAE